MKNSRFKEYRIKQLCRNDISDLQGLCEKCSDYYILDQGTVANEDAARKILDALPPDKTLDDQYNLGIYDSDNNLLGIVNIIDSYPENGSWMLGLILIDPSKRNIGLGRYFHQEIINFAKTADGKKIIIGVLEDNQIALRFWKSIGYKLVKETKQDRGNNATKTVLVFSLDI